MSASQFTGKTNYEQCRVSDGHTKGRGRSRGQGTTSFAGQGRTTGDYRERGSAMTPGRGGPSGSPQWQAPVRWCAAWMMMGRISSSPPPPGVPACAYRLYFIHQRKRLQVPPPFCPPALPLSVASRCLHNGVCPPPPPEGLGWGGRGRGKKDFVPASNFGAHASTEACTRAMHPDADPPLLHRSWWRTRSWAQHCSSTASCWCFRTRRSRRCALGLGRSRL